MFFREYMYNEADDDLQVPEDNPGTPPGTTPDITKPEGGTDETKTDTTTPDGTQTDEDPDEEGTDEEDTGEEDDTGEDTDDQDMGSGEESTEDPSLSSGVTVVKQKDENLKKYKLIDQYKELLNSINIVTRTLSDTQFENPDFQEEQEYVLDKFRDLLEKINFTITVKFLKDTYQILLKLFFYFKYQLKDILTLTQSLYQKRDLEREGIDREREKRNKKEESDSDDKFNDKDQKKENKLLKNDRVNSSSSYKKNPFGNTNMEKFKVFPDKDIKKN